MNQDVKALPVVAYRWVPSPYWGDYVHSGNPDQADEAEKFGITVEPLVLQSDAESALAELRAEVERLRADTELWARIHAELADAMVMHEQRADTAEAQLERARGLLREAADCAHWAATECAHKEAHGLAERVDAFLGEGK